MLDRLLIKVDNTKSHGYKIPDKLIDNRLAWFHYLDLVSEIHHVSTICNRQKICPQYIFTCEYKIN